MSFEQDNSERSGQVRAGIACSQPKSSARFQRDKSKKQKSNISKRFPKLRDFGEKRKEKKKGTEEEEESRNAFDIFPACAYKSTRQVNFYVSQAVQSRDTSESVNSNGERILLFDTAQYPRQLQQVPLEWDLKWRLTVLFYFCKQTYVTALFRWCIN
ncbi:hypothetical protein TWF225_006376 [Orbilia oligospora]|nr:hypothetical protein TWF225_006376 [Orbilia oligospora]